LRFNIWFFHLFLIDFSPFLSSKDCDQRAPELFQRGDESVDNVVADVNGIEYTRSWTAVHEILAAGISPGGQRVVERRLQRGHHERAVVHRSPENS
jgi:hypothetical protein